MALPADFNKIFGSTATGGLTPIGDVNYAKGWEFVGSNPPTKNDFSYLQNLSDLKSQWLYSNKLQRTDPFGDIKSDGTVQAALDNLGLGEAAKREVGTGANQIPDMSSFASGTGWMKFPNGTIIQFGVSMAGPIGSPTTVNFPIPFTSSYRIATSFDSAISRAPDCPAFATTPASNRLSAFHLMSSRTGGVPAGANWIAIGK